MTWFGKPKCPHCGNKTIVATGYSFPYPQYRCTYCYAKNSEKNRMQKEINDLKRQVQSLK